MKLSLTRYLLIQIKNLLNNNTTAISVLLISDIKCFRALKSDSAPPRGSAWEPATQS
jgi:hypothetical protein